MMRVPIAAIVVFAIFANPLESNAQDPTVVDRLRRAIVRVEGKETGSGIVIAVEDNLVRVITARHVVEGYGSRSNGEGMSRRSCTVLPEVVLGLELNIRQRARVCTSTDDMGDDLALLEVPVSIPTDVIRKFRGPRTELQGPGSYVSFLARDQGFGAGRIMWNDATSSLEGRMLVTGGLGVLPGFSGGAMIDEEGALAGMVLATSNTRTTSLRWQRIAEVLTGWNVADPLDPSQTPPDGTFRPGLDPGPLNQAARSAVREYRQLLNLKDGEALKRLYPKLERSATVDALFGDAVSIHLRLRDCVDRISSNQVSCEYHLEVTRRTGSLAPYSSTCFMPCDETPEEARRLVFTLVEGPLNGRWLIKNVTEGVEKKVEKKVEGGGQP